MLDLKCMPTAEQAGLPAPEPGRALVFVGADGELCSKTPAGVVRTLTRASLHQSTYTVAAPAAGASVLAAHGLDVAKIVSLSAMAIYVSAGKKYAVLAGHLFASARFTAYATQTDLAAMIAAGEGDLLAGGEIRFSVWWRD